MDWREFVASIVDSLAWPAAIVVLVVLLRGPLAAILGSSPISRLKVGPAGAEVEWHQAVAEVRAEVVASGASKRASPLLDGDTDLSDLAGLADREPAKAIEAAFARLLTELRRSVEEADSDLATEPNPHVLLKTAYRDGLLTKENAEAFRGMLTLRDLTAQRPQTATAEKADDFLVLARAVLYALSRA